MTSHLVKEALIKYKRSLQDLKRAATRQILKLMATSWRPIVLNKEFNNVDVRFKSCPAGLSGYSALCVIFLRRGQPCLHKNALIAKQPESQRLFRLNQSFLKAPGE